MPRPRKYRPYSPQQIEQAASKLLAFLREKANSKGFWRGDYCELVCRLERFFPGEPRPSVGLVAESVTFLLKRRKIKVTSSLITGAERRRFQVLGVTEEVRNENDGPNPTDSAAGAGVEAGTAASANRPACGQRPEPPGASVGAERVADVADGGETVVDRVGSEGNHGELPG
jgi:hypothetical protein